MKWTLSFVESPGWDDPDRHHFSAEHPARASPSSCCLLCWNSPRGGFEVTPTTQNSLSCTQQMQALLWFHPRFLRFGFGVRQVKACLTPMCSNPQGPPWEGTTLPQRLLLFYVHKVTQTWEAIKLNNHYGAVLQWCR